MLAGHTKWALWKTALSSGYARQCVVRNSHQQHITIFAKPIPTRLDPFLTARGKMLLYPFEVFPYRKEYFL